MKKAVKNPKNLQKNYGLRVKVKRRKTRTIRSLKRKKNYGFHSPALRKRVM